MMETAISRRGREAGFKARLLGVYERRGDSHRHGCWGTDSNELSASSARETELPVILENDKHLPSD